MRKCGVWHQWNDELDFVAKYKGVEEMDLKEFDLDLPYVADEGKINSVILEKGCLRNEATKFDYEANWKDKRRAFRLETRCISAMFEIIFGKMTRIRIGARQDG